MKIFATAFLVGVFLNGAVCAAQTKCSAFGPGRVEGVRYSNDKLGLSYVFPAGLEPQDLNTVQAPQVKMDTAFLLLLWKSPKEFEKPSIIVMTDDPGAYPDHSVNGYLRRIENSVTMSSAANITKRGPDIDISGMKFLRLDYQTPSTGGLNNTSITGQFKGCEITFQFTAKSQSEIEGFVRSLQTVEFIKEKSVIRPKRKAKLTTPR